jgi:hypothetical protein
MLIDNGEKMKKKSAQFRLTLGFREVLPQAKFGWKKLQVSGISKSLLYSP